MASESERPVPNEALTQDGAARPADRLAARPSAESGRPAQGAAEAPADTPATAAAPLAQAPAGAGPGRLVLRVMPMPRDTNHYGTIFGGVILSYIDQAGFVEASRHGAHRWVTAALERVEFRQPVRVGDIISLRTRTVRTGRTSVTVRVEVDAARPGPSPHDELRVTEATITLVATDGTGRPIPFRSPPAAEPLPAAQPEPPPSGPEVEVPPASC